jgi:Protein of unknown function (DUF3054)
MLERRVARAAMADIASVVVFVAVGRRSHEEDGNAVIGALGVAAPFIIGVAVAWAVTRAWRRPLEVRTGLMIWPITVAVGMVLRRFVFDRGTAASFIIVATIVLGVLFVGWRLLVGALGRRSS